MWSIHIKENTNWSNKVRTRLLPVWASRLWSKLQSGCLTICSEWTSSKSSAAVFVNVTGLIKVQPKAVFLTQDWHKTVSTTWLLVALWSVHWHSQTQQFIVWASGCRLIKAASRGSCYDCWQAWAFLFFLDIFWRLQGMMWRIWYRSWKSEF